MNNNRNILFFNNSTMMGLHQDMDNWQEKNQKRFLSMSIKKDAGIFCCIALTNPSEVVIVDAKNSNRRAAVSRWGSLYVKR